MWAFGAPRGALGSLPLALGLWFVLLAVSRSFTPVPSASLSGLSAGAPPVLALACGSPPAALVPRSLLSVALLPRSVRAPPFGRGCGRSAPLGERFYRGALLPLSAAGSRYAPARCYKPQRAPLPFFCSLRSPLRLPAARPSSRNRATHECSLRSRRLRSSRPRVPLAAVSLLSGWRLVSSRATLVPSLLASGAPCLRHPQCSS